MNAIDTSPISPEQRIQAIQTLIGLIQGIAIDLHIDDQELALLNLWLETHAPLLADSGFEPILQQLTPILHQRSLNHAKRLQLLQLCQELHHSDSFFDQLSNDLQQLQGLLTGILADNHLSGAELNGLASWLQQHRYLNGCWPYDEIHSLIQPLLLSDSPAWLLAQCQRQLQQLNQQPELTEPRVALCQSYPQIQFPHHGFAFIPHRLSDDWLAQLEALGGSLKPLSPELDYLVIDSDQDWSYLCYQPEALHASQWRREGYHLRLIRLQDFKHAIQQQSELASHR